MSIRERYEYVVDLVADKAATSMAKFRSEVSAAEGPMGKFKAVGTNAMDAVKANVLGLASVGGAALLGFVAKSATAFQEGAIEAGKFAQATGLSNEEASRWVEIAGDIGIESSNLESAFGRFNKELGESPEKVAKLGVEVVKTKDGLVDTNATLANAIARLGEIKDPTERAAVAQQLFGRSWQNMAELVGMSADDLKSSLAGVSDQQVFDDAEVARARELRAAWDDLSDRLSAFMLLVGGKVVPVLADVAETASEVGDVVGDVAEAVDDAADAAGRFLDKLGPLGDGIKKLGTYLIPVYGQVKALGDGVNFVTGLFGGGEKATADWTGVLDAAGVEAGIVTGILADQAVGMAESEKATQELTAAQEAHNEQLAAAYDALNKVREAHEAETTARRAAIDATFAARQAEADFATQVWNTTTILNDSTASTQAKQIATDEAVSSAAALADAEVRIAQETATANGFTLSGKAAQKEWAQSMIESASQLDGPLRQSILDYVAQVTGIPAERVTEVFAEIDAPSVDEVEGLLAELARERIARVQVRLAGGTVTGDGGISFGGGMIAGAEGGIIRRPTLLLAGEAGPEALVPLHRTPGNGPLPQSLSGGGPTVVVHVNTLAINDEAERAIRGAVEKALREAR